MSKRNRKRNSAEFKTKVALAALKEDATLSEIAARFEIHPNMVSLWKRQTVEGMSSLFAVKAPIKDEAAGNHREVLFGVSDCLGCPKREECPIKSVREGYGFSYDKKQVKMARRRAAEKTAAFKDRYRHRSGVESTMSAFDRLTGVKHLRVRGMEAVRFAVMLKAVGVNLYRAAAAWKRNNGGNPGGIGAFEHVFMSLLCLHAAFWSMVRRWFIASASGCPKWPPLAARTI
jgi:transposase-like protein